MSTTPLISIVVAAPYEAVRMGEIVDSCLSNSPSDIEVVCIISDDDETPREGRYVNDDRRVRIVRPRTKLTTAESRRAGAADATAPYVLFLDLDQPGHRQLDAIAARIANGTDADIVGLQVGLTEWRESGGAPDPLTGSEVLQSFSARRRHASVRLEDHLIRTDLLREVYEALPVGFAGHQPDDIAILFMAFARAESYVEVTEAIPPAGLGARAVERPHDPVAEYRAVADAIGPLSDIEGVVMEWARNVPNPEPLVDGYNAVREATIGSALRRLLRIPAAMRRTEAQLLKQRAPAVDIVAAATVSAPSALSIIVDNGPEIERRKVRSVVLAIDSLTLPGESELLRRQAGLLLGAGYRVVIASHGRENDTSLVPKGATLVEIVGSTPQRRFAQWNELCRQREVDLVLDHRVLQTRDWIGYASIARMNGVATIGAIDNAARGLEFSGRDQLGYLRDHVNLLQSLLVPSALDVAFWKLRGVSDVAYLPAPPSPLESELARRRVLTQATKAGVLDIAWWGRLNQNSEAAIAAVEIARVMKRLDVSFKLSIVATDTVSTTTARLTRLISARGLDDLVTVMHVRSDDELLTAIEATDVLVSASPMEPCPGPIDEAHALGLPVVVGHAPRDESTRKRPGVIPVPTRDPSAFADAILKLAQSPVEYERLSREAVDAATARQEMDFAGLYESLLLDRLPAEFSPDPTLNDARTVLDLVIASARSESTDSSRGGRQRSRKGATSRDRASVQTAGRALERKLTPMGHRVLRVAPWLKPTARNVKRALLRH